MDHRSQLEDFIKGIETAAYERGLADGHTKGLAEGRSEATREVGEIFRQIETLVKEVGARYALGIVNAMTPEDMSQAIVENQRKAEPRQGSDQARVLDVIRANPGLRGVDIALRLRDSVQEQTVRTAIHRLKNKSIILNHKGGWVAAPKPQGEMIEGQPLAGD